MIADLMKEGQTLLTDANIPAARLDAEVLLAHVLRCERSDLFLKHEGILSSCDISLYRSLIARRIKHEPIAYIINTREFWSIPIRVTPDVLIPRPETEGVVERALEVVAERSLPLRILDLCTGSGCIAVALAHELPHAHIIVSDLSQQAIDIAKHNLTFAAKRIEYLVGNLFSPIGDRSFDIITANPPYLSDDEFAHLDVDIVGHEPHTALRAGNEGLDFIIPIIEDAVRYLRDGGWLIMEVGEEHAKKISAMTNTTNIYETMTAHKDLAGIERVIALKKHG